MNIITVIIDTLRYDACGSNAGLGVRTPNMDRLAARATAFDRCVIGSFPTIPHRTDCFTGNVNFPRIPWKKLDEEAPVLPELLGTAGYNKAFIHDTPNMEKEGFWRGFDKNVCTWKFNDGAPRPEDIEVPVPPEHVRGEGIQYKKQMSDWAHYKEERDWFVANTFVEAARWLEQNARQGKFFLWVDTFEVHETWYPPKYYVDLYDPGYDGPDYNFPNYSYTDIYDEKTLNHLKAGYKGEVTLTDRWLGYLLDQIDVMNLWDDTLVILSSDHGMFLGEHRRMGKHTVAGEQDAWPLYEEVSHVPLLVWLPGAGTRKKNVGALVEPVDITATILDVAGVEAPNIMGRSCAPLIKGETDQIRDTVISGSHKPADGASRTLSRVTVTTPTWTYIAKDANYAAELYDAVKDPRQERNVADRNPDVCAELQKLSVDFLKDGNANECFLKHQGG